MDDAPNTNALIPPPLRRLFGAGLERALNKLLALDPATATSLSELEGRQFGLRLSDPPIALRIRVEDGQLRVGPPGDGESDLDVSSGLGALLARLLPDAQGRRHTGPSKSGLRMSGDVDLAQKLQKLAKQFDPDWEQPFVDVFGDVLGVQIARGLRATLDMVKDHASSLARDGADYLTEESQLLAHPVEQLAFGDQVDQLRDGVERLEARLRHIGEKLDRLSKEQDS